MFENQCPSDSSDRNFLLLRKSAAILGIAAAALGGCTTNIDTVDAQSEQQQSQEPESPMSAAPEMESPQSTTHIEEEQSELDAILYKMGPDRVEYQTVLDGFYSYSEDELEDMISSENGYKLRAKYIAALYMKYSYGDKGEILYNNEVNIDGLSSNKHPELNNNPLFGMDPTKADDDTLNSAFGAIEVAVGLEALETLSPDYSGSDDFRVRMNKSLRLVAGPATNYGLGGFVQDSPGFYGLHTRMVISSFQNINTSDIRPATTLRTVDTEKAYEAAKAYGFGLQADKWFTLETGTTVHNLEGTEIIALRGVVFIKSEDIYTGDDGDRIDDRVPDFNEVKPSPYYEYGEAHPRQSFIIPVPVAEGSVPKDLLK